MPLIQTSESAHVSFSPHGSFKYRTIINYDTLVSDSVALQVNLHITERFVFLFCFFTIIESYRLTPL